MAGSRAPFGILKAVPESLAGPAVTWTPVADPPATAAPSGRLAEPVAGPGDPVGRGQPPPSGPSADRRPAGLAAPGLPLPTDPPGLPAGGPLAGDGDIAAGGRPDGGRRPPAATPTVDARMMLSEAAMRQALQRGADTDRRALAAIVRLLDERAVLQRDLAHMRAERDALAIELDAHRRATARNRKAMLSVLDEVARFFARHGMPARLPAPAPPADTEPDLMGLLGPRHGLK